MAEHHKLPLWLQEQIYPIGDNLISAHPEHFHISKPPEPGLDTSIYSITGYHMKGMLGFVEYLILLILLKGSLDHVAARFNASLKRKDADPLVRNSRDLVGLSRGPLNELSDRVLRHLR